jgi:hypothetical protein
MHLGFKTFLLFTDLSLYVFESVELELSLTSGDGRKKSDSPFDYPILLLSGMNKHLLLIFN